MTMKTKPRKMRLVCEPSYNGREREKIGVIRERHIKGPVGDYSEGIN